MSHDSVELLPRMVKMTTSSTIGNDVGNVSVVWLHDSRICAVQYTWKLRSRSSTAQNKGFSRENVSRFHDLTCFERSLLWRQNVFRWARLTTPFEPHTWKRHVITYHVKKYMYIYTYKACTAQWMASCWLSLSCKRWWKGLSLKGIFLGWSPSNQLINAWAIPLSSILAESLATSGQWKTRVV